MDFQESLDYLYGLQLFGIKLGLENMQALKARLPLLQKPLPCVHVAGTNGKGSVSNMLAEILREAGFKVGLYTSPHLHCFTERIRINGVPLSTEEVVSLTCEIRDVCEELPVTFFEATTAMALLAFQKNQVDIAIVETGLGGRLDATNIVEPLLCLITPVSYDHSEHLGETLGEIAAEKAGIIKANVPVVIGKQQDEAFEILKQTAEGHNAEIFSFDRNFRWDGTQQNFSVDDGHEQLTDLSCSLEGAHQLDNFTQAVVASLRLREQGFDISDDDIRRAGKNVQWPGRLEWLDKNILLDVSHNRAGVESLARYLYERNIDHVHLVVGLSGERDPEKVLKPLEKIATAVYAVPVSYGQAVSPDKVCRWAERYGIDCHTYQAAEEGLAAAIECADQTTPVVICGSLYLAAELRKKFLEGKAV